MAEAALQDVVSPDGPVFREPWEARVFALVVSMCRAGVFTWPEWTETLVKHAKASPCGEATYDVWLDTLEDLLVAKETAARSVLDDLCAAWRIAAETTPHGRPIELAPGVLVTILSSRGGK